MWHYILWILFKCLQLPHIRTIPYSIIAVICRLCLMKEATIKHNCHITYSDYSSDRVHSCLDMWTWKAKKRELRLSRWSKRKFWRILRAMVRLIFVRARRHNWLYQYKGTLTGRRSVIMLLDQPQLVLILIYCLNFCFLGLGDCYYKYIFFIYTSYW